MLSIVLITGILTLVLRVLIQVSISECIMVTLYSMYSIYSIFYSCVSATFLKDPEYFWPRSPISIPYHISISIDMYYARPKFGIFISA